MKSILQSMYVNMSDHTFLLVEAQREPTELEKTFVIAIINGKRIVFHYWGTKKIETVVETSKPSNGDLTF